MSRWRPVLRMARRDLWRHKGRTLLTMLLVALPVLVGVAAAQLHHSTRWEGERAARVTMGAADALVEVTPFARTRVEYWPGDMSPLPDAFVRDRGGKRQPQLRDRSSVDLAALLPPGSRIIAAPQQASATLATGGTSYVRILDAGDPVAEGLAAVTAGVAPAAPDEVALGEVAADELGLLDADGQPLPDATVELLDGTALRVVGVLERNVDISYGGGLELLAAPGSILAETTRGRESHRHLVDLPEPVGDAPHALAAALAEEGVALLPRDLMFHPADWQVQGPAPGPVDPRSLAVGALVVLFGLVEVVLIVGSVFAVGARRQVRDLGLVAASGGAPADVRRVLLAQGLVLGAFSSLLGAAAGVALFRLGTPVIEGVVNRPVWSTDLDWLAIVGVTLLGSLTGLVAAFVPARSIGRLTPVAALTGRFPLRAGESRAHRPAFVLVGVGLVALVLSGWWTSAEYAPPPPGPEGSGSYATPSTLPVVAGALSLLLVLGGVVWAAPYVVRRLAGLGRWLPLSGRFAFRDAARHRFRTAAAAVTLTVTVAGAVFAGFVVQGVAADMTRNAAGQEHLISVYLDHDGAPGTTSPARVEQVVETIHDVVGPATTIAASRVARSDRGYSELAVRAHGRGYAPVRAIDEGTLRRLVGDDPEAVQAFRDGGVVTTVPGNLQKDSVTVALAPGARKPENRWTLPAVTAERAETVGEDLFGTWVSEETAGRMGLVTVPSSITVLAERAVTSEDMERLAVHGIEGWSPDTDLEMLGTAKLVVAAGVGLLTVLVVGMAVALSAAEGRADQATMAAVGAGPWRRRSLGAMHGLFLGAVGTLLGVVVGGPAGAALLQVDGAPGLAVPWLEIGSVLLLVPLLAWVAGWLVTSTRLSLVRRTG